MRLRSGDFSTLVILGAGATRGALNSTRSPRVSAPLNGDYFDVLANYVKTKEGEKSLLSYKRLLAFLENEIGRKGIAKVTMEEVFNVLFISKDLPQIFHKGRGRKREAGYRQEVKDFLSLLIKVFRFVQSHCRNRDNLHHHDLLASILSPRDVIMTLNYDTMMDNALALRGWNPQRGYGFNAKVISELNHPDSGSSNLKKVTLLKPHGSFNWFAKGRFSSLESLLERRPVSRIVMSQLPRVYESSQKNLVRFFIPPLYTKFFKNKFWTKVWVQTYEAVKDAERLVIIGCSLIATDYHLRAILSKAISDRNNKYREIIVVDPSLDVKGKLKSFFRGHSETGVRFFSSFTDFLKRSLN